MILGIALLTVFAVALLACWGLAKLAPKMQLMASPGGHRRHHAETPMVGGLGIFIALMCGVFFDNTFIALLPSLFALCIIGSLDDRFSLPSLLRLLVQGAVVYLMIQLTGVRLLDLGALFSTQGQVLLGEWSTAMTIFATIGVINAVNMSDGMDGLAGSLLFLLLLALLFSGSPSQVLILMTLAALAGFLVWNIRVGRSRAFVFMGDAGSTMLGLLVAYLLIEYSQFSSGLFPVTALWLLALPLTDAVAVLIVRPLRGRSPFSADRIHYHHQLIDKGLSVNKTLLVILVLQSLFIVLGLLLWQNQVPEHLQLLMFLTFFIAYTVNLLWFTRASKMNSQ